MADVSTGQNPETVVLYDETGTQVGTPTNPLSVNAATVAAANAVSTGTITAASASGATPVYAPNAGATAVELVVPAGHSSWQIALGGTFSTNSQVFFEGSETGLDADWFALNGRRNSDATTNDETSLLDASPFGGPSPQGAGVSYWRGSIGAINFMRVRCGTYTTGDSITVRMTTSVGPGAIFQNASPPLATDNFKIGTLAAPGDTVVVGTAGAGTWAAQMTGNFTGTIFFEQTVDGNTWNKVNGGVAGVGTLQTQLSGTGTPGQSLQVVGACGGRKSIRLRAGADFAGSFTGQIRSGAGSNAVFMAAPVPIAGLSNGAQTTRQAVGTAQTRLDGTALPTRTTVEIRALAANTAAVYVGFSTGVTTGNGREVSPGESWTLDITTATQLFGISTAAGQAVQVTELG